MLRARGTASKVETLGLKPGDYMSIHPADRTDGALDEEVLVAISGYGPTRADVWTVEFRPKPAGK